MPEARPDAAHPDPTGPVAAVRALLEVLGAPPARQALLLEQALAAQMALFTGAPAAASFDPLARTPAQATPPRPARPAAAAARRRAAPPAPDTAPPAAGRGSGGIGAVAATASREAARPALPPPSPVLAGIATALAGLVGAGGASARPAASGPGAAPAVRVPGAVQVAAGALAQGARTAGQALRDLPGGSGVAPALQGIAALGAALAGLDLARVPTGTRRPNSADAADAGAPRRAPSGMSGRADGQGRVRAGPPAAPPAGVATAPGAAAEADAVGNALAGIGRLTVELFTTAARAGAPNLTGGGPAPRAPTVLVPASAPRGPVQESARAPAAPGVTVEVDADTLARALRAEAELRGTAL